MKNNYCLPITSSSFSEVSDHIKANSDSYEYFEIWLDYIEDLNESFLIDLMKKYQGSLIFLFRRKNLEKPHLSKNEQIQYLKLIENSNCLIDLDIYDQKELIQLTDSRNKIISYHNYDQTPDETELKRIITEIKSKNPAIVKISTYCHEKSDALLLLKIMLELDTKKIKHIILGMGQNGQITRIFGTLWGNELTFIPMNETEKTADGQLTKADFEGLTKEFTRARK